MRHPVYCFTCYFDTSWTFYECIIFCTGQFMTPNRLVFRLWIRNSLFILFRLVSSRKNYSQDWREKAIEMYQKERNFRAVGRILSLLESTVESFVKKTRNKKNKKIGRKFKLNDRQLTRIKREAWSLIASGDRVPSKKEKRKKFWIIYYWMSVDGH